MAISLAKLKQTKEGDHPPFVVGYGVPGIGKTAWAAEFPDPLYLNTAGEKPPSDVDLETPGQIESLEDIFTIIGQLLEGGHAHKTLIIDSLSGIEPMVWAATCLRCGWASIEEPGFGKGYVEADTEWHELISGLHALTAAGMAVVVIAHPEISRFDSPTTDPYSRYGLKLQKRAHALIIEAADVVAFLNYRVSIKEKEVGFNKKVGHAEGGGDRQIHLEERPGFIAKNRGGMPSVVPFKKGAGYSALASHFIEPAGVLSDAA